MPAIKLPLNSTMRVPTTSATAPARSKEDPVVSPKTEVGQRYNLAGKERSEAIRGNPTTMTPVEMELKKLMSET